MYRSPPVLSLLTAAVALVVAGPAPAPAATPADTTPPQVSEVRFGRASVAVAGLALVPVTVSARFTDASGVAEIPYDITPSPQLTLSPVPGWQSLLRPVLTRTSGTATDGIWSATVHVPSTWYGTVRVIAAGAQDVAGNVLTEPLTGDRSPALRVTGVHRPVLTHNYELLAAGGFRIHGRAYWSDTRRPIARQPLAAGYDSNCDLEGAANNIVTDAAGYYEKRWVNGGEAAAGCIALLGPAGPRQRPTVLAYHVSSAPQPSIPDRAMLSAADLRGAVPTPVTDDSWSALRPPRPCADRPYPSAALLRADRALYAMVGLNDRPTVVLEHVAFYRADGAHQYLQELRQACDAPLWTLLATGVAGDESVLLRLREYLEYADTYKNTYVLVARSGRALAVVADTGWETGSGHEDLVRELGAKAVRRLSAL